MSSPIGNLSPGLAAQFHRMLITAWRTGHTPEAIAWLRARGCDAQAGQFEAYRTAFICQQQGLRDSGAVVPDGADGSRSDHYARSRFVMRP